MTERQNQLYYILKIFSEQNPNEWINKDEIINLVKGYDYNPNKSEHSQNAYAQIRADIKAIRDSSIEESEKVIISCKKGYKMASREDYVVFAKRNWRRIVSMIKRQQNQDRKAKLDGQFHISDDELKEISAFIGGGK